MERLKTSDAIISNDNIKCSIGKYFFAVAVKTLPCYRFNADIESLKPFHTFLKVIRTTWW